VGRLNSVFLREFSLRSECIGIYDKDYLNAIPHHHWILLTCKMGRQLVLQYRSQPRMSMTSPFEHCCPYTRHQEAWLVISGYHATAHINFSKCQHWGGSGQSFIHNLTSMHRLCRRPCWLSSVSTESIPLNRNY